MRIVARLMMMMMMTLTKRPQQQDETNRRKYREREERAEQTPRLLQSLPSFMVINIILFYFFIKLTVLNACLSRHRINRKNGTRTGSTYGRWSTTTPRSPLCFQ